jgi:P2-related tail formation protein
MDPPSMYMPQTATEHGIDTWNVDWTRSRKARSSGVVRSHAQRRQRRIQAGRNP